MEDLAGILIASGQSAVEVSLFILLPIMVVMLSLMLWLESRGVVALVVRWVSPLLLPLGITGLALFAMIQEVLVSSAAPLATLALMARSGVAPRYLAATTAMVMALAQANVVFPLAAIGLDLGVTMALSISGGVVAAMVTYHLLGRHLSNAEAAPLPEVNEPQEQNLMALIRRAGQDAWQITMGAMPLLIVTLVAVNLFRATGAIDWLEGQTAFLFEAIGFPRETLLLTITRFVAGGTAMMGLMIEQVQAGVLSARDVNLLAGLMISPLDLAGVAIFATAGKEVAKVMKIAVLGALVGVIFRSVCHFYLYL